jgi:ubiquinone/menaquinone biosynthesis C-methylase UbiE
MNLLMDTKETRRLRGQVCAPLQGEVVEIGFGTGLNLPHLPTAVVRLRAVDPLTQGRKLAADRLAATDVPVDFVGLDGQELPLEDESADAVLCTWTLCSIPDPISAVREIKRILRPNGGFHFIEHGKSPDAKVLVWQNRLNGIQQKVACGCNLNRDISAIVEAGGLAPSELETFYSKGEPKPFGWTFKGVATRSS